MNKNLANTSPWEREEINFKVQRTCAKPGKISSSVSFQQYFQEFHIKFNIRFRSLTLLEMFVFEKIILKQSHRSLQNDVNNPGANFVFHLLFDPLAVDFSGPCEDIDRSNVAYS